MKERAPQFGAQLFAIDEGGQYMPATGARPRGAADEAGAAMAVRQMVESIAPR
jgi:hypothetical protein